MTTYRREIDGLRAVAVIPVIFFHAGSSLFNGGFVGVDVFFVISGYLITSIIIQELSEERFSLVNFYERRVRRILPALFLVMLVTLLFAWRFLLPSDVPEFSKSLIAVPLFIANFHFMENDYFGIANELKPMLHTWSLAVEEQFYAVIPFLLLVTWRFGLRAVAGVVILLFMCSLVAMIFILPVNPDLTFFMLPTRAWELLLGSAIAVYFFYQNPAARENWIARSGAWIAQLGSAAGLSLIAYSVFVFSEAMPFPSVYALMPTIGTALVIIFASPRTLVGQLLGNKLLVAMGLGSYSAYLWHFPLFSLIRYRAISDVDAGVLMLYSLLIIPLSYLSWRFIETPFRNRHQVSRRVVFGMSAASALVLIGFGVIGAQSDGIVGRPHVTQQLLEIERNLLPNVGLRDNCQPVFSRLSCVTGDQPRVMVWGDSQAASLVHGMLTSHPDLQVVQATTSSCGPVFEIAVFAERKKRAQAQYCLRQNDAVRRHLEETTSIQYVVLAGAYSEFFSDDYRLVDREDNLIETRSHREVSRYFVHTVQSLERLGKTVIVFSELPTSGEDVARCHLNSVLSGADKSRCDFPESVYRSRSNGVLKMLEAVTAETNATVIDLAALMCTNGTCSVEKHGVPMYRDENHLSKDGSAFVMREIDFGRLISE